MSRFSFLKIGVIIAGIYLVATNFFNIFAPKLLFGFIEIPNLDINSLILSLGGVFLIYFAIYRIHPKGQVLGSGVD